MKNYIYILLLSVLFFVSCSNETDVTKISDIENAEMLRNFRSLDEAYEVAINSISLLEEEKPDTRTSIQRRICSIDSVYIIKNSNTKSRSIFPKLDTLIYIFNFDNNEGFAVVSANKETDALLAVSDSGSIRSMEEIDNPGLSLFMNAAKEYVVETDVVQTRSIHKKPVGEKVVHDTLSSSRISPKVTVKWDQKDDEGAFCPNHVAGCFTIAAFQAMSYFDFPSSMSFTFSEKNMDYVPLPPSQWNNIRLHKSTGYDPCSEYRKSIIGHICREICERCCAVFHFPSPDTRSSIAYDLSSYDYATSTTLSNFKNGMNDLGFITSSIDSYTPDYVRFNLNSNNLIFVAGNQEDKNVDHVWIADGYKYYVVLHKFYRIDGDTRTLFDSGVETVNLCHYNWGWGGVGNGYFNVNVFRPSNASYLDQNSTAYDNSSRNYVNIHYFSVSK